MENAIHSISLCTVDSAISFPNTYSLDSDLSSEKRYLTFEQPGPGHECVESSKMLTCTVLYIYVYR